MDTSLVVHGDDFFATGPVEELRKLSKTLGDKYPVKKLMVSERSKVNTLRVLNRDVCCTGEGITYQADNRHIDSMVKPEVGGRQGGDHSDCEPGEGPPRVYQEVA